MKINIANISVKELVKLCELLGLHINNPRDPFNSQITKKVDGAYIHVGWIEFPVMDLFLEDM